MRGAELWICDRGLVEYRKCAALQADVRERVAAGDLPDLLLSVEHPPVYTLGRRSTPEDLPLGDAWYRARGIDLATTDRGGKLTYHGPGQLVGYPIMRVDGVLTYVRRMEAAIVDALGELGIEAGTRDGLTGVWVQDRKIASIGVRLKHGVTTHGFAINVENDLEPFDWVVPCGTPGVGMTSVSRETAGHVGLRDFRAVICAAFCRAHDRSGLEVAPEWLGRPAAVPA